MSVTISLAHGWGCQRLLLLCHTDMMCHQILTQIVLFIPHQSWTEGSLLQRTVATADTVTSQSAENKSWENTLQ